MAEFPALPLWTDALLADTGHLGDDEFGRYMRLLILIWRSPACRIPCETSWVEKRLSAAVWPLVDEFCQRDGNWITQKRLMREWVYVKNMSQRNSEAAKSRWNKNKQTSERITHASSSHAPRNAPTPTPIPKKKVTPPTVSLYSQEFPEWWPKEAWEGFVEMRKRIRATLTDRAVKLAVAEVTRLKGAGQDPQAVIDQSTQKAWRGLFPVKGGFANGNGHANGTVLLEQTSVVGWVSRLEVFYGQHDDCPQGTWSPKWGPRPDELGAQIPKEALAKFGEGKPTAGSTHV